MSEAELHVLRARLEGGIRNKAARGELRQALPVGLVWGEQEGEILIDPDEAMRGAIATIFDRFGELGSVRQVWLWMRREGVQFPMRRFAHGEIQWTVPTYHQIHSVLESPVYAGAYAFGKTRRERYVDEHGQTRPADASPAPDRMGGVDLGAPPRLHRQGHLREPIASGSPATPGRARTSPAARSAKAPRCCKGSRPAGAAGASSRSTIKAGGVIRAPPITARAASWSRTAAAGVCGSAEVRSTRRSPARCSPQ